MGMSKQIAVLLGSFHKQECEDMLEEVRDYAARHDLEVAEVVWVPGSMEKPLALKKLLAKEHIDGAVVLGIIEKGETKHGLVMANAVTSAIINLQLEYMKPVGIGILGPDIHPSQIPSRVRPYGRAAVRALDAVLS